MRNRDTKEPARRPALRKRIEAQRVLPPAPARAGVPEFGPAPLRFDCGLRRGQEGLGYLDMAGHSDMRISLQRFNK